MRSFTSALILLVLIGCATTRAVTPREYLDEATAATVTVVADAWIYSEKRTRTTPVENRSSAAGVFPGEITSGSRDFLSIYAIDVNLMGAHRQYLAVLQSLPTVSRSGAAGSAPTLELQIADQTLYLQPITGAPRELGIAQTPVDTKIRGAQWWYFPVSKHLLTVISGVRDLQAALVVGERRTSYEIWRDGSAELAELTDVLP